MQEAWVWYLQQVTMTRDMYCMNAVGTTPGVQKTLTDLLIPSLLYIRLGSLFDEGLELYIASNRKSLPGNFRDNLNGRIERLAKHSKLTDGSALHAIRNRRNQVAHESPPAVDSISTFVTWDELDAAIAKVTSVLTALAVIVPSPPFQFYFERIPLSYEPLTFEWNYGIKVNGEWITKFSRTLTYGRLGSSS